jgi:hypothetical protein
MHTYTFPHEHFKSIMDHMVGLQIVVSSLTLNGLNYTMVCTSQIDSDQYNHLHQMCSLEGVV